MLFSKTIAPNLGARLTAFLPTRWGAVASRRSGSLRRADRTSRSVLFSGRRPAGVPLMPLSPRGLPRGSAARSCVLRRRPAVAHRATSGRTREPRPAPPSRVNGSLGLALARGTFSPSCFVRTGVPGPPAPSRIVLADACGGAHEELSAVSPTLEALRVPPISATFSPLRLAARGIAVGTAAPFLERREPPALRFPRESPATRSPAPAV
jgi:hypothetical protein